MLCCLKPHGDRSRKSSSETMESQSKSSTPPRPCTPNPPDPTRTSQSDPQPDASPSPDTCIPPTSAPSAQTPEQNVTDEVVEDPPVEEPITNDTLSASDPVSSTSPETILHPTKGSAPPDPCTPNQPDPTRVPSDPQPDASSSPGTSTPLGSAVPVQGATDENVEDHPERRIVIIGSTGNGKSATANTILGKTAFESKASNYNITKKCQYDEAVIYGKRLFLVDTPAMFSTSMNNQESLRELGKVILLTFPGFHAVVYVVKVGRFTQQDRTLFEEVCKLFDGQIYKQLIILFTGVDNLVADGMPFEDYVKKHIASELTKLVKQCGNRVIGFNNRASGEERVNQVNDLLGKIETIVKENPLHTDSTYDTAQSLFKAKRTKRVEVDPSMQDDSMQTEMRKYIEEENNAVDGFLDELVKKLANSDTSFCSLSE